MRDRWGIPHIFAERQNDLFAAQGFVQAQDRLFQMDLWRRSVQGRLSQVLGPNFIERDAMTRRVQYRGDLEAEWASYGPDARAIAAAFVRGINAWVTLARERPPEEFVLAGWQPEFWSAEDLLNRTDAFVSSGDAIDEVRREQLSDLIADAIGRVGAPPFFVGLAADIPSTDLIRLKPDPPYDLDLTRSHSPSRVSTTAAGALAIVEAHRRFTTPSPRYFVHLKGEDWNVIGATSPWLPGVALGHNEHVAWGMTLLDTDTQDIFVEDAGVKRTVVRDAVIVKGRREPFVFETEVTDKGIVIAVDREKGRLFTLSWRGREPGAAAELGAIALGRAGSGAALRDALTHWKMPARRVTFADVAGVDGVQNAALGSLRRPSASDRAGESPPTAQAVFVHPLAISAAARQRFNVGPVDRARDDSTVQMSFDTKDWDRSRAVTAPGQSESPSSSHFADLAKRWTTGDAVPLVFSDAAVAANTEATLTLVPKRAQTK